MKITKEKKDFKSGGFTKSNMASKINSHDGIN
jgi:hypothetical protein